MELDYLILSFLFAREIKSVRKLALTDMYKLLSAVSENGEFRVLILERT